MLSLVASLAALVAALAVAPAAAMEVESVGVIDWQRVHVGVPRTVLEVSVKRQVWATDASVVAGIATRTGAVDWRFVLPEGERDLCFVWRWREHRLLPRSTALGVATRACAAPI